MKLTDNLLLLSLAILCLGMSCGPKKDYLVTIHTSLGDVQLLLYDDTPLHKANFLELAEAGRYDSTIFHRVIREFMIQGGDVNSKEGTSPSANAMIPAEIHSHHFHRRGAVAAARTGNPERKSSECQFYIVQGRVWSESQLTLDQSKMHQYIRKLLEMPEYQDLKQNIIEWQQQGDTKTLEAKMVELRPVVEQKFNVSLAKDVPQERLKAYTTIGGVPHLDDEYTVFGEVVAGMEVVDAIAALETDGADKPLEDIAMEIEVEEMRRSKITKLFGFQYPVSK